MRPEVNQADHTLGFCALWKWLDRATFEREISSLSRGLDAGQKMVVEVDLATRASRVCYRGRIQAPGKFNRISQTHRE